MEKDEDKERAKYGETLRNVYTTAIEKNKEKEKKEQEKEQQFDLPPMDLSVCFYSFIFNYLYLFIHFFFYFLFNFFYSFFHSFISISLTPPFFSPLSFLSPPPLPFSTTLSTKKKSLSLSLYKNFDYFKKSLFESF